MAGTKHNLTLTLDSALLKEARIYAARKDTSVNRLVREYLEKLVEQKKTHSENVNALNDLLDRGIPGLTVEKFNREEIYSERLDRWIR